ncbi:unnamed protein product [Adineta steineri]|uniref:BZIP domain-containing protein n=1 Tax=Adineta steineri TaxID=433720 RepID=A0A814P6M4_9BILA|nr:unnamed protein product [Adineta steineri]CAF1313193.1 unnamed protein product [Adineta steineri]
MPFEQHHFQDLLPPSINDGGSINKLNSSLTSLDFYLLDDIEAYLSPPTLHSKTTKHDLINDSINDNSQHHEDFFADFVFPEFEENSDFVDPLSFDEIELEKWISQSSFPSPPMDLDTSPLSSIEDTSSTLYDYPINSDMIVPFSPSLSSEKNYEKKTQNKTAAEKYRVKKKSERHILLDRHLKLKNTNTELKLELENLTFRVEKFKKLFVDLLQIDLSTSN